MKRAYTLIFFLLISAAAWCQPDPGQIAAIKATYKAINAFNGYKKVTLQSEDFLTETTDGGGSLTGYFKNGKIAKIVTSIGVSDGVYTTEFYFSNDAPIFIYQQFSAYVYNEEKNGFDWNKKDLVFEGRYYVDHQKLIEKQETAHGPNKNFSKTAPLDLLAETNKYLKLLYKSKQ